MNFLQIWKVKKKLGFHKNQYELKTQTKHNWKQMKALIQSSHFKMHKGK